MIVHGPSGDTIDTDTFAPVVGARYEFASARSSASGRDVLVTDSGNFQSVLLSFDRDPDTREPTVEIAHEAFLREWARLRGWIEASRDDLRLHAKISSATYEWDAAGRDADYLLTGARLAQVEETSGDDAIPRPVVSTSSPPSR